MSKDYYQDLQIKRDASDEEIAYAYRTLCLKWHPQLCTESPNTQQYYFSKIAEAYEVLSDSVKRAFFDKFGEEKLKDGLFSQGELKGGYRFKNNALQIFEQFYWKENSFAKIYDAEGNDELGSLFGSQFGGKGYKGIEAPKDLNVIVEVTLEELYNGCSKVIEYPRQVLNNDSRTTSTVIEKKQLEISPGIKNKVVIQYQGQGNEAPQQKPSNLIFTIEELAHPSFRRKGNDLIYVHQITLLDALNSPPINIQTLDGRNINIPIDTLINPKYIKQVIGEGMPIDSEEGKNVKTYGSAQKKGDLYIKFDIEFPKEISEEKKQRIRELLQ